MKKSTLKTLIIALLATALIGFCALITYNYKHKTSFKFLDEKTETLAPEKNKQDEVNKAIAKEAKTIAKMRSSSSLTKALKDDFILGDPNAPVTMIEYASLSCPHCASFTREAFDKIDQDYISQGKVKFIFRNFPLNQQALVAAMFTKCQAEKAENKTEKYYSTLKVLFKTQNSWAFDGKFVNKLAAIANLDSMSNKEFGKCVNDQELSDKFLEERMEAAQALQLRSTPTFFINGEISEGYVDYKSLKKIIEKKLKQAEQNQ